jgi:type II secretory pathway pseudopilin PulG
MPVTGGGRTRDERGVTYLMLMFAIVLIGISTTAAAKQWKAMVQRELEADLLSKGIEIQNALALYSATLKAGRVMPGELYPQSLADLTRLPKPFLRKAYSDPMTHGEWEYLRAPTGGIMGVRSKSRATPFRKHDFPQAVRHFEGRASYHDWLFQHPNPSTSGSFPPGPIPPGGAVPNPPMGIPQPTSPAGQATPESPPNAPTGTPQSTPPAVPTGGSPNPPS